MHVNLSKYKKHVDDFTVPMKEYNHRQFIIESYTGINVIPLYARPSIIHKMINVPVIVLSSILATFLSLFYYNLSYGMGFAISLGVALTLLAIRVATDTSTRYIVNLGVTRSIVKGIKVDKFNYHHYNLIRKYAPTELDNWIHAIIDYGVFKSDMAKEYAEQVISQAKEKDIEFQSRITHDQQSKEDKISEQTKLLDKKWENKLKKRTK